MLEKSHRGSHILLLFYVMCSSPSCPPYFSVCSYLYHTKAHPLQREKPPGSMKFPNTSETRIVSHTLRFKFCPVKTKDQPKSVCVSISNREAHQQLTNVHLKPKPTYLFHVNKLPINYFSFSFLCSFTCLQGLLLFMLAFESVGLNLFDSLCFTFFLPPIDISM